MITTAKLNVTAEAPSSRGAILERVFKMLDREGIAYCVLHGYEGFPGTVPSDVDCIIEKPMTQSRLVRLFHANRSYLCASVVRLIGLHITLAGREADGAPCFLELDFAADCAVEACWLFPGEAVLASRRRNGSFWVPAPATEFGCYLGRSIAKSSLDAARVLKLVCLFHSDAAGCEGMIAQLLPVALAGRLAALFRSGDHHGIIALQPVLRSALRRRAITRHPLRSAAAMISGQINRAVRILNPHGLSAVFLGPDGAGKSSTVEAVEAALAPAFSRTVCWGFAPHLRRLLKRKPTATDQPHALAPRSLAVSLLRAGYWFSFNTLGYVTVPFAKARSTLVLYDRHFVDILVDTRRYRYGGPRWLLDAIWALMPMPDLVILLNAPAEVLQSRKQEVPYEVTARQLLGYLRLVRPLANGRIIDAAQPKQQVCNDACQAILRALEGRIERRFALASCAGHQGEVSLSA